MMGGTRVNIKWSGQGRSLRKWNWRWALNDKEVAKGREREEHSG